MVDSDVEVGRNRANLRPNGTMKGAWNRANVCPAGSNKAERESVLLTSSRTPQTFFPKLAPVINV